MREKIQIKWTGVRENRRQTTRIPFRKKIRYGLSDPIFLGHTFNLSENGIGIKANKVLPPGSRIVIHIYTGNGGEDEIIRLEGIVARLSSVSSKTPSRKGIFARVSPVLPGTPSIIGIRFSICTDHIKHIYHYQQNKLKLSKVTLSDDVLI